MHLRRALVGVCVFVLLAGLVLVRKSASASLSTLAGAYGLSGRKIEVPSGAQSVQTGAASVTAPGLLSATFSSNREGVVSAPASGAMNLAVAPDGGAGRRAQRPRRGFAATIGRGGGGGSTRTRATGSPVRVPGERLDGRDRRLRRSAT